MQNEIKARVFISCGQTRDSEEERIANSLKGRLELAGFQNPYVAINEQTTSGLKENILSKLEVSEYFIFIDFKREALFSSDKNEPLKDQKGRSVHRGSLFSNQELAIAISQGKRIIALQERAVKERDGMFSVAQINPIQFTSRDQIVDIVMEKVAENKWDPNWRDEIEMSREDSDFSDAFYGGDPLKPARFFHIRASNRNKFKTARNCVCYIKKLVHQPSGELHTMQLVEIKWKIIKLADAHIPPQEYRKFDAFFIIKNCYDKIYLGYNRNIIDYPQIDLEYQLLIPGVYDVSYEIYSENFRPTKATFRFQIPEDYGEIQLKRIG